MLAAGSVQEAHDFALVGHAATLRARIPFLHFFDGFRTSHEIDKIDLLEDDDIPPSSATTTCWPSERAGLTPDAPVVRGTAQNPDVFFQAREAANPFHAGRAGHVQEVMDELAAATGRQYHLADYHGAPDAERVIVVMGSAAGAVEETVDAMVAAGRAGRHAPPAPLPAVPDRGRAGRPAPTTRSHRRPRPDQGAGRRRRAAVPSSRGRPGRGDGRRDRRRSPVAPRVIGGALRPVVEGAHAERWSSPSSTSSPPARPKRHVTVGIYDDVTHLSLPDRRRLPAASRRPARSRRCSSASARTARSAPTRPRSRSSARAPTSTPRATSCTTPRSRARSRSRTCASGPGPIRSTYLVDEADFIACHQFGLLGKTRILDHARPGATFLLNAPYGPDEVWAQLPGEVQRLIIEKDIDAVGHRRLRGRGGGRHGHPHQHGHAAVLLPAGRGPAAGRGHQPHQGRGPSTPTPSAARPSWPATSPPSMRRWPSSRRVTPGPVTQ